MFLIENTYCINILYVRTYAFEQLPYTFHVNIYECLYVHTLKNCIQHGLCTYVFRDRFVDIT